MIPPLTQINVGVSTAISKSTRSGSTRNGATRQYDRIQNLNKTAMNFMESKEKEVVSDISQRLMTKEERFREKWDRLRKKNTFNEGKIEEVIS